MLGRVTRRTFTSTAVRLAADDAAASSEALKLSFCVPAAPLAEGVEVKRVTVPGRGGTYGIQKDSPALLSELRPGMVQVEYAEDGKGDDEFFIPGGFAFTHPNNTVDVSAPDAYKLEDIDVDALKTANADLVAAKEAAAAGSREEAEALVALEVYKSLASALKVTL